MIRIQTTNGMIVVSINNVVIDEERKVFWYVKHVPYNPTELKYIRWEQIPQQVHRYER